MIKQKQNSVLKRFVAIGVMLILMLSISNISVSAAETGKITASTIKTEGSDTVKIAISISENPGIWGLRFYVSYDHDALTLTSAVAGKVFTQGEITAPPSLNEKEYVFLADRSDFTDTKDNGEILTLTFNVKADAKLKEYPIKLKVEDAVTASGTDVKLGVTNGSIIVNEKPVVTDPENPTVGETTTAKGNEATTASAATSESTTTAEEASKADKGAFPTTGGTTAIVLAVLIGVGSLATIGGVLISKGKFKTAKK